MNNTFSFERFGKVLALDFRNYIRNYGISLIVLCSVPIAMWILSLIFDTDFSTVGRGIMFYLVILVGIFLAPTKAYGKANLPREGVAFAMLPATALEKFLSMFLYCAILTPLVCFVGSWVIDSLLTLLPFGGFKEFVKVFSLRDLLIDAKYIPKIMYLPFKFWFSSITGLVFWSAIFMLGNMIFKKRKAGKTLACILGINYVLTTIFSVILMNCKGIFVKFQNIQDEETLIAMINPLVNWSMVINTALLLLVLYFVYRKIKIQKY